MGIQRSEIIQLNATDPHKAVLAVSHWLMYW